MEEYSVKDPSELLKAASDLAFTPGALSENSVKDFLIRFPLPVIIGALQTEPDIPNLESALVDCLERIFKTRYGASLIPHYLPFVVAGLRADSQRVRCLACKTISCLEENDGESNGLAAQLVIDHGVYPLLLDCLTGGDEKASVAALDAIKNLAASPGGMEIVFPTNVSEATNLRNVASRCSPLGRVRILALIVKLFSISVNVASSVYNSNLLSLLEAEVRNVNDTLITLSVLELLYELAEIPHSTEFLVRITLLQLLSSVASDASAESILRSRAMMISGRLLSKENIFMFVDEPSVRTVISAIDGRFGSLESQDADEFECALEALGQIGSSIQGASLLLSGSTPAARHVVNAAFDHHGRGKMLAALHSLANILGETRPENDMMLSSDAEETLRRLIYETASQTPKMTPSGLLLSVLKLESEFRIAGYRVITGMAARPWFLVDMCSRQEIINTVIDPYTETTKIGMEARHNCCQAVLSALMSSGGITNDPALSGTVEKLLETVGKGPYRATRQREAQPEVMTAERF